MSKRPRESAVMDVLSSICVEYGRFPLELWQVEILPRLVTDPHAHNLSRLVCSTFARTLQPSEICTSVDTLCLYAARHGSKPLLTWALPPGVTTTYPVVNMALRKGQYELVHNQMSCMHGDETIRIPSVRYMILLQLARDGDIVHTQQVMDLYHMSVDKFLLGYSSIGRVLVAATKCGHLDWLVWFYNIISPGEPLPLIHLELQHAAKNGHLEFLRGICTLQPIITQSLDIDKLCFHASTGGHLDIIKWAAEHGRVDPGTWGSVYRNTLISAAISGNNLIPILDQCYLCNVSPTAAGTHPFIFLSIWSVALQHLDHSAVLTRQLLSHHHTHHAPVLNYLPTMWIIDQYVFGARANFTPGPDLDALVAWIVDVAKYPVKVELYAFCLEYGALAACRVLWPKMKPLGVTDAELQLVHRRAFLQVVARGDEEMLKWMIATLPAAQCIPNAGSIPQTMPTRDCKTPAHIYHARTCRITHLLDILHIPTMPYVAPSEKDRETQTTKLARHWRKRLRVTGE